MKRYTPGPWFKGDALAPLAVFQQQNNVRRIVATTDFHGKDYFNENLYNANLIAAAPELLEALEGILDIGKRDMSNPKYDAYFRTAKEAVAKIYKI